MNDILRLCANSRLDLSGVVPFPSGSVVRLFAGDKREDRGPAPDWEAVRAQREAAQNLGRGGTAGESDEKSTNAWSVENVIKVGKAEVMRQFKAGQAGGVPSVAANRRKFTKPVFRLPALKAG